MTRNFSAELFWFFPYPIRFPRVIKKSSGSGQQFPFFFTSHPTHLRSRPLLLKVAGVVRNASLQICRKNGTSRGSSEGTHSPWKLGGLTPLQLAKRVYHEVDEDEVLTRSAALAYYFVSALIPMIFFLMATLGLFAKSHDLQSSLFNYTARFMPGRCIQSDPEDSERNRK